MNFHQNTGKTIQEAFEEYHKANPHVFNRFVSLALEAIRKGKTKISFKLILNVIRWESYMQTKEETPVLLDDEPRRFRLNDVYGSRYARMFIEQYPDYEKFIELRELRSL